MSNENRNPRRNERMPDQPADANPPTTAEPIDLTDETISAAGEAAIDAVDTADADFDTAEATTGESRRRIRPRTLPDTFLDERDDVLTVIAELEDQLDRYEELRETLERDAGTTQERLTEANQRTQELEWQVVTLQTRIDTLEAARTEYSQLEDELNQAHELTQRINSRLDEAERDNARLTSELKAANKQLEELWTARKERDGLRTELKTCRGKIDQLEQGIRDANDERASINVRMQDTISALEETRNARHQLELELRGAVDRNEELRRVQESLAEKLETLRGDKKGLQVQLAHLERENNRLVEQRQYYERELAALRSQNRTTEQALGNVKKAFAEVRVALSETKARARRRTVDNWPRIMTGLRGLAEPAITGNGNGNGSGNGHAEALAGLDDELTD